MRLTAALTSAAHSRRPLFAIIAVMFPVVVQIAITVAWWARLPDRMATTFGPDGGPSGYSDPLRTVILLCAIQTLFLVASVASALAEDRSKGRIACAVTAGFVAFLATCWLILAGSASSTLNSAAWWLLLAGPAWAGVPYLILNPVGDRNGAPVIARSEADSSRASRSL